MKTVDVPVGSVICDSLPFSTGGTVAQAIALKTSGVVALALYLGAVTPAILKKVLDAGLGYMPVTFGGEYEDGADDELVQLKALGIPKGCCVWLDMEGLKAFKTDPAKLISMLTAWANKIEAAGFIPCLYVGVPQPLTSDELWKLPFRRYWKGQGSVRDRFNNLAEPTKCGWSITQMWPSHTRGGAWVDSNIVGQDFLKRSPTMAVA